VRTAYGELEALSRELGLDPEGIVIQEYVEGDPELGVGLLTETAFGPVVMLGRGGTDIEETGDVTFRTVPLSSSQARTMLDDLESVDAGCLTGAQRESIAGAAVAVSDLYLENRWIEEGDVNPLIVTSGGAVAVDGLFVGDD
jgi:acyl-CoA synthetase (NDP forming)